MDIVNDKIINEIKSELIDNEIPCYIYDLNEIYNRISNITNNMPDNFKLYYAIKANPNKNVLEFIKSQDKIAGFEIASSGELIKSLDYCDSNEILYTGPAKTNKELELAVDSSLRLINVESITEAVRINNIAERLNKKVDILIRVNIDYKIEEAAENMGGMSTKMGIDEAKYYDSYEMISKLPYLNIKGIHVFSASGILNYVAAIEQAKYIFNMINSFEKDGNKIEIVDFGGGLGVDYTDENKEFDYINYFKEMKSLIKEYKYQDKEFILELGCYLVASCGYYLAKIIDIKESKNYKHIVLAGGLNHIPTATLNGKHPFYVINMNNEKIYNDQPEVINEVCDIDGPLCTAEDKVLWDVHVNNAAIGDIVVIKQAGAYCYSAAWLEFLSHQYPYEFIYDGKRLKLDNSMEKDIFKRLLLNVKKEVSSKQVDILVNTSVGGNLKECINYLIKKYPDLDQLYASDDYKKLVNIFTKTRIEEFPRLDFYLEIPLDLSEKFKLKVYRLFSDSHLFEDSKTLINMIGVLGLFEDDVDVQNRINTAIKIFFYQKVYSEREELLNIKNIIKEKNTLYVLDENVWEYIPEELKPYIFESISPKYYIFLKNMKGNFGRKMNDFLSPYDINNQVKKGINKTGIFKEYLDKKQNTGYHPYIKNTSEYYTINPKLSLEIIKETLKEFEEYELTYGPSDIKSMFRNCKPVFNKDFYKYFMDHQTDIVNSRNSFSKLPILQEKFYEIINYYREHGNNNPDYITIIELLRNVPYEVKFGDEDFAKDAHSAGVLKNSYDYYVNLLAEVRKRYTRTIPNYKNYHQIIGRDGNNYIIETKILDGTDYLNMLIGESKYTDCCQKSDDLGRECLEHASTSKNGGILLISLVTETGNYPLTQSWIWKNEQEMVIDNVEQTLLLKVAPSKKREIYEDLIAEAIKLSGNEIIEKSNLELKEYIYNELLKDNTLSRLKKLSEIALRQEIKVITLGSGYSDIIVKDYFDIQATRPLILPKDYSQNGYSDANIRYVVSGSEDDITVEPDTEYEEEPIYRIQRKIFESSLSDVSTAIIKKVLDIDNVQNINSTEQFYNEYNLTEDCKIVYGEDWYIIYRDDSKNNEIIKYNIGAPRINDEYDQQINELQDNIKEIEERILSKILKRGELL